MARAYFGGFAVVRMELSNGGVSISGLLVRQLVWLPRVDGPLGILLVLA